MRRDWSRGRVPRSRAAHNIGLLVALFARCDERARRSEPRREDGFKAARHRAQCDLTLKRRSPALDQAHVELPVQSERELDPQWRRGRLVFYRRGPAEKRRSFAGLCADPTDATARAVESQEDAYEHMPEEAADVYAFELPPLELNAISDYRSALRSLWSKRLAVPP